MAKLVANPNLLRLLEKPLYPVSRMRRDFVPMVNVNLDNPSSEDYNRIGRIVAQAFKKQHVLVLYPEWAPTEKVLVALQDIRRALKYKLGAKK